MSRFCVKSSTKMKIGAGIGGAAALLALSAAPAFAAESITSPNPYTPTVDVNANPIPSDIYVSSTGWTPGTQVVAEVCDGKSALLPTFNPTIDCDNATSPGTVVADSNGNVVFDGSETNSDGVANFQIGVFRGQSPQDEFNCLAPGDNPNSTSVSVTNAGASQADVATIDPADPSWGASTVGKKGGGTAPCQIRLSTNNADRSAQATDLYLPLNLPQNGTSSTSPGSPLPESPLAIALPVGAVALFGGAGIVLFRKRRSSAAV